MSVYKIDGRKILETHDRANPDRERIVRAKLTEDGYLMVETGEREA